MWVLSPLDDLILVSEILVYEKGKSLLQPHKIL